MSMKPRFPSGRACAAPFRLLLIALAWAAAGAKAQPTEGWRGVVDLPSVNVKGDYKLPKPESWQYARMEGFEILSNAKPSAANRLLQDFQKFRDAFHLLWQLPPPPLTSSTLIICDRDDAFGAFVPFKDGARNGVFSLFERDAERSTIIIDIGTLYYDANIQGNFVRLANDFRRQLCREYARLALSGSDASMPPWLLEAQLQIIMDMECFDRVIKHGKLDMKRGTPDPRSVPPGGLYESVAEAIKALNGLEERVDQAFDAEVDPEQSELVARMEVALQFWTQDPPFNIALYKQPLMPLAEMFSVTPEAYARINPLLDYAWTKQVHAFAHYCQFGANGAHKEGFDAFVARLETEPASEALFVECYEMSYEAMLKKLRGYINYPIHKYNYIKLRKDQPLTAAKVAFREATQSEVGRIKGDAQQLAGLRPEALETYRVAYARKEPPDGELLAALGLAELAGGDAGDARAFLEAATVLQARRPSAWATLARLRLDEAVERPAQEGRLSAEQMASVLIPLLKGRGLQPAIAETYRVMVDAWETSAIPPNVVQIGLLQEGALRFPAESDLALRTARLYAQAAALDQAEALARFGLEHAADSASQRRFEAFIASLKPRPSPPGDAG